VFSLLLTSSVDIQLPEFEGDEKEIQRKRYNYYRSHFFDNLDLKHPAVIRTPFLHPKIDQYITKLTSQEPDSIILAVDYLLKRLEHDPEAYRYYLADFLNKYAQMKIVGQDAIYVHMVDTYYRKGKAPWLKEENLKKMEENANDLRPILINKIIPDITTYKQDGSAINLHSVQAQYTVVIFWAPDCGHCKQIMPSVVKFEENNRDKGLKIFAVCTKGGDKTTTCWPAIEEKKMQNFINTADEYGRFNQQIRIKTTPKIFILDSKKKIIMKDISGEDLEKIFNDIYDHDQKVKIEVK
jgi:thiol-disulfide isomerase/thioredoxin